MTSGARCCLARELSGSCLRLGSSGVSVLIEPHFYFLRFAYYSFDQK